MSEEALAAALEAELGGVETDDLPEKKDFVKADDADTDAIVDSGTADTDIELDPPDVAEARAKGWDPDKEAYEKRTGQKWVSAEVFLAKREMADEISRRGREMKRMTKELADIKKNQDALVKAEVERRVQQLKTERAEAIREQDFEEIDRLDAEIDKAKAAPAPESDNDADEEDNSGYLESKESRAKIIDKWKKESAPWFEKSAKALQEFVIRHENAYALANQGCSIEDSLEFAREAALKKFPELSAFGKRTQTGGAPRGGGGSVVADESKLDAASKDIIRRMEKSGAFKSAKEKADFIRELGE